MGAGPAKFDPAQFVGTFQGDFGKRYEIIKQLGAGAQGAAYLVRPKAGGDLLVAKETHDVSPDGLVEFIEEFDKMRNLRHPNCIKVFEMVKSNILCEGGEWKDQVYIISELAPGGDLYKYMKEVLQTKVTMTEEWVASIFQQGMQGVSYLHSQDIVHNDLKPDNILMLSKFDPSHPSKIPTVVINDFGCATLSKDHFFKCGDPRYQSAETWEIMIKIINGQQDDFMKVGPKADVWSMAATLYELLSGGLLPFLYRDCALGDICGVENVMDELGEAVTKQEVKIRPYCDGISPSAEALLQTMFVKDPSQRPSAADVLRHEWFSIKGHQMTGATTSKLTFNATKGVAQGLLLNALATKLQRDHIQSCTAAFKEVDVDNNGSINLAEFKNAYAKMSGQGDADAVFKAADIDQNGTLDFNEFMAVTFNWKGLQPNVLQTHLQALFSDMDKDGNGTVKAEELGDLFQGTLSKAELHDVFFRIDVDGDGEVTKQELHHYLFEDPTPSELERYEQFRATQSAGGALEQKGDPQAQLYFGVMLPGVMVGSCCLCGIMKLFGL